MEVRIMAIKRTKSGTYRVEVFFPANVRGLLNNSSERFRKTVPTLKEARELERSIKTRIELVEKNNMLNPSANISFSNFFQETWFPLYLNGSTGYTGKIPQRSTIKLTHRLFRLHILPLFGKYSLNYLNNNKQFVFKQLVALSQRFANIKQICGYVNQVFETAEFLDYIEYNKISKVIKHVADPKKQLLKKQREINGVSLTAEELDEWLKAVNEEYRTHKLSLQDYVLFYVTLFIGDRKSESYALQWKHVNLPKGSLSVVQSLDDEHEVKATKANKRTTFIIPQELINMLSDWKSEQRKKLLALHIKQTPEQFLFTYTNAKGEINQSVHPWYLNNRLKTIQKHHPHLAKTHPHALRHTFATLAREGGASLDEISSSLTHSNIATTRIYVNTPDVVGLKTYQHFKKRLSKVPDKTKKRTNSVPIVD